mgnify:CR=1 FL=1
MSFKVAASDFDGTLFRNLDISTEDLSAIRNWQAAGNKLGIVTGRCYPMLMAHLKEFQLAIDFSICCNGAIIYDGDGEIIFETELPKKILLEILNEPLTAKSFHFLFEAANEIFCANLKENSWIIREKERWGFPLELITPAQISTLPKIKANNPFRKISPRVMMLMEMTNTVRTTCLAA